MLDAPHFPDALLDVPSETMWRQGVHVLQGHRLAPTDAGHIAALLRLMDPPGGALVADIGCGFGTVAQLMREQRPDLAFLLLNRNAVQLGHVPRGEGFRAVQGDMHALPIASAAVDGCMILYTLCHADLAVALGEAARITRPGGFLFVYDYERLSGDNALAESVLASRWIGRDAFAGVAMAQGWEAPRLCNPAGDDAVFRQVFGDDAGYAAIFRHLRPVVWKLDRAAMGSAGNVE